MVVAWTLSANPSDNYLECNGQAVDSTNYPKLYALMHNVPDYRGVFLRGLGSVTSNHYNLGRDSVEYSGRYYNYVSQGMGFDASHVVPVANENRPINKAVRYFIKAK